MRDVQHCKNRTGSEGARRQGALAGKAVVDGGMEANPEFKKGLERRRDPSESIISSYPDQRDSRVRWRNTYGGMSRTYSAIWTRWWSMILSARSWGVSCEGTAQCTRDTTYDIPLELVALQVGEAYGQLARTRPRAPRERPVTTATVEKAHHDHNDAIPSSQNHRCRCCARPEVFFAFGYHSWRRYPFVDPLQAADIVAKLVPPGRRGLKENIARTSWQF